MKKKSNPKTRRREKACKIIEELPEAGMKEMIRRFAGLPPSLGNPIADAVAAEVRRQTTLPTKLKVSEFCAHDASRAADFTTRMKHQIHEATSFIGRKVVSVTVDKAPQSMPNNPLSTMFEINLVFEQP